MIYLQLFLSFLQVGAFSFGGGYAAMPLIKQQVITAHHWLSVSEFTDLISISQMTPGPIAVNSATFVGIKIAGIPGAICATIGCVLPSCIIVGIISYFLKRTMDKIDKLESEVRESREAQYLLSEKYATKAEVAEIKATMQKLTDNIDYIKEHTTKNEDFIRVMTRLESKIDNYCSK
jgi:hypothetical protein